MSERAAVRFLSQATFGAKLSDIEPLRDKWRTGWLDEQFSMPVGITHWENCLKYQSAMGAIEGSWDQQIWEMYISRPDQLRKRVGYALSQIMVVSVPSLIGSGNDRALCMAAYTDILERGAFGNFRNLIQEITLSPAMGYFLSYLKNSKAVYDTSGNAIKMPDENYAREIMQLFTIGTVELNTDGTTKIVNGSSKETYNIDDVMNLARVFTGWRIDGPSAGIARWQKPMWFDAKIHSPEPKNFLSTQIPANTDGITSLKIALDALFNHPNVGPFIGKQLIQKLVVSNPSASYISRVAQAFNNDGNGVRGNMKAVIRQIFLDPEAMSLNAIDNPPPSWGKLREPVTRYTQLCRLLDARLTTAAAIWGLPATYDPATKLGQSPGRAPSVFNFYDAAYTPPGTEISTRSLVAPEFQLLTEVSVLGILNFFETQLNSGGPTNVQFQFAPFDALANNATALIDKLCLYLANASISAETRNLMIQTINRLPQDARLRVKTAILMILASAEYVIQK